MIELSGVTWGIDGSQVSIVLILDGDPLWHIWLCWRHSQQKQGVNPHGVQSWTPLVSLAR